MYDHVGLKVKNMEASVNFYRAALEPFGHVLCSQDDSGASFGPPNQPDLWLYPAKGAVATAAHVAFKVSDRALVNRFHKQGLQSGGRDNGGPGIRADYGPKYYAAYLLDPDGHNIEAVCTQ
jgi:catechol 2,3-dioxygenase-like lactoylglutathione lyase family enzyme